MPDRLDPHTLRETLAEAWWRGRCSANERQGEWAGPALRERCAKDIADLIAKAEAPPETGHAAAKPTVPPYVPEWLERYVQESQWPTGHSFSDVASALYVFWLRVKAWDDAREAGSVGANHVICPNCAHQFRAIPVNVQDELATLRADVARLTAENAALKAKLDVTTDDFGCVPMSFSSVIDGIDSRQTQEAVENLVVWHMRRAEQADAERDAARLERDSAREQFDRHVEWASQQEREARAHAWAEAVEVVEQVASRQIAPGQREAFLADVLDAFRVKQREEPK